MPWCTAFHSPSHEPLRDHRSLELQHDHVDGPISFLNPTRAAYKHNLGNNESFDDTNKSSNGTGGQISEAKELQDGEQSASNVEFVWSSRNNRKGRHALIVDPSLDPTAPYIIPRVTTTLKETAKGIGRMVTQYPYWDISWLVATIFTLGSCVWVINAFLVFLPLVQPQTEFHNEILTGGGVTAFIGATVFEIGSVFLLIEALNENRSGCFGWALERALVGDQETKYRIKPNPDQCTHHHTDKKNIVGKGRVKQVSGDGSSDLSTGESEKPQHEKSTGESWIWFPSWQDLKAHYLRELGFLASLAQFCGATIFWISGFTALPGVNDKMSQGLLDGIYWVPQILGGSGFIISGSLYMLETQSKWYLPAWGVLGW